MSAGHVVGIDDARFPRDHRGDVMIVGTVFSGSRLDGVLSSAVRRDGADSTDRIEAMVGGSRFAAQLAAVMLQGIALAGFNVVDIHRLHESLGLPVLVVARRPPDLDAIRRALLANVPGGRRKWRLIERAGPMEPVEDLWIQRAGLDIDHARAVIRRHARESLLPEPLRTAHLIAGGVTTGESRQRA
ncbi:MAG: DUF99 family protein [Wenzhouxiangellaceae bacterium]|nr:DUF99 family protein [Wenzhouxiangellaceae bacterium]